MEETFEVPYSSTAFVVDDLYHVFETLMQYKLYVSLGHCVVAEDPPEKDKLQLLNSVRYYCWYIALM